MGFISKPGFSHRDFDTGARVGVLVTNLGTPEAPQARAVRRYLAEFLSDPRVIEVPRWLWMLILHGVILRIRPARSARAYQKVWTDEGSPLLVIARRQCDALRARLHARYGDRVTVELAMRYGQPAIGDVLRSMQDKGVQRLLVVPLYPQYSASTTGSTFDAVSRELTRWRWIPELRFLTAYHDDRAYIEALASSITEHWAEHGRPSRLLFSFHGLPRRYLDAGDPYHCQCHKTARLVAERLDLRDDQWTVSFQSRVGREEWLRPYTDELLKQWGSEGVADVQVVCPGFSADCLETLEEIAIQNREFFEESGGSGFSYIPALNDRPAHIDALETLVERNLGSWRESREIDALPDQARAERASRAARLGASQ